MVKNLPAMQEMHSVPGLGRSPGGGNGNPRQYSRQEIPRTEEPGRLRSTVHRFANSQTQLSTLLIIITNKFLSEVVKIF